MNSRRCNLRTIGGKTQSTPEGLTVARSGPSRADRVSRRPPPWVAPNGYSPCPRFAGLPVLPPDVTLRKGEREKAKRTSNLNFYVAHPFPGCALPQRSLGSIMSYVNLTLNAREVTPWKRPSFPPKGR